MVPISNFFFCGQLFILPIIFFSYHLVVFCFSFSKNKEYAWHAYSHDVFPPKVYTRNFATCTNVHIHVSCTTIKPLIRTSITFIEGRKNVQLWWTSWVTYSLSQGIKYYYFFSVQSQTYVQFVLCHNALAAAILDGECKHSCLKCRPSLHRRAGGALRCKSQGCQRRGFTFRPRWQILFSFTFVFRDYFVSSLEGKKKKTTSNFV